uniref:Ig-like domain-containing protein n=1 Tax=Leptobrachium leishanense TaxID=445787 RepID=A0A8C5R0Q7_9ANUR
VTFSLPYERITRHFLSCPQHAAFSHYPVPELVLIKKYLVCYDAVKVIYLKAGYQNDPRILELIHPSAYILQSRKTFVFGQFASDDLTIFIKPSNSIVEGANVTIHCQTAKVGEKISLYKNGKKLLETQFGGYNAEFHIYKAVKKDQGNYFCMRQSDSKLSSHIQLTVQVLASDDLTIFIKPSNSIVEGANVTIHCQASKLGEKISLYKNGMKIRETQFDGYNAEFHIYKAVRKDQDNYFCMRQSDSKLSNHIQLTVQDADSAELPVSGDVDYSKLCQWQ